ncbi:hypothetical protein [Elizabethkingia occulta]|nr:hypothetical protein [Elizabethkingia occulta]
MISSIRSFISIDYNYKYSQRSPKERYLDQGSEYNSNEKSTSQTREELK